MALVYTSPVITANNTNTDTFIFARRGTLLTNYTIWVYGTFSSGTVALQGSPDSGTTFIGLTDNTNTAVTFTANGSRNLSLCNDPGVPIKLRFALTGAGSPSLTYKIYDDAGE